MEMERRELVDVWAVHSKTRATEVWQHEGNMWNIVQCGGLNNYAEFALLDTEDRPVPEGIKTGELPVHDIWVPLKVLQPNVTVSLN